MRCPTASPLIIAALLVAAPACATKSVEAGTEGKDALIGEWVGKCSASDQDGGHLDNVDTRLSFSPDGKYRQSMSGPDGGQVDGTFTVTGATLDLKTQDDALKVDYSIQNGVLTTKTHDNSQGPVSSTCTLHRAPGA